MRSETGAAWLQVADDFSTEQSLLKFIKIAVNKPLTGSF